MLESVGEVTGITAGSETRTSPYCEIVIAAYAGSSVGAGAKTVQSPHGLLSTVDRSASKPYCALVSNTALSVNLNLRL